MQPLAGIGCHSHGMARQVCPFYRPHWCVIVYCPWRASPVHRWILWQSSANPGGPRSHRLLRCGISPPSGADAPAIGRCLRSRLPPNGAAPLRLIRSIGRLRRAAWDRQNQSDHRCVPLRTDSAAAVNLSGVVCVSLSEANKRHLRRFAIFRTGGKLLGGSGGYSSCGLAAN